MNLVKQSRSLLHEAFHDNDDDDNDDETFI